MVKRVASILAVSLVLTSSAFAIQTRPTPNSANDDSPVGRAARTIVRVVNAIGHWVVAPLDDGPTATPPKP
jgi:hypothetical protein